MDNDDDIEQKKKFFELLLESGINYINMSNPNEPEYSKFKVTENDIDIKLLLTATNIYMSL